MPLPRRAVWCPATIVAIALLAGGCSNLERASDERVTVLTELVGTPSATASARLVPIGGSGIDGKVSFAQYGALVVIRTKLFGLPPGRAFGLHVHEGRNCTRADGSGIGGHFNPGNALHGRPDGPVHHAGDLANLVSDGEGYATYSTQTGALTVTAGPNSLIGRVIVLASRADDYTTQPDGNSGPPLACGFIRSDAGAFGVPIQ
jgi:Cu-Zn family superoxide dismutase